MALGGKARKVTIFVGQPHGEHGSTYLRVMERLKAEGAAGATAFKAIAAFGARDRVQTLRLSEIVPALPVMIVWIDTPERVSRILPHIQSLVTEGLIAIEDTDVSLYVTAAVPDLPASLPIGTVMTRDVFTVQPDSPMAETAVKLIAGHRDGAPVIDATQRVVGMITIGDLFLKGGLPIPPHMLETFDTPELHDDLMRLARTHGMVSEIMSTRVVTVPSGLDVRAAAELMCQKNLLRLPVVDAAGVLEGIVSRADLVRAVAGGPPERHLRYPHPAHVDGLTPVGAIMTRQVPTVPADATVSWIVDAVVSTPLNRAVVVDEKEHVLGVVTDAELVQRLTSSAHPSHLAELIDRLPFRHPSPTEQESRRMAKGRRAQELMVTDIVIAPEHMPIRDVLAGVITKRRKIAPVVDASGALVGVVDRIDLLAALIGRFGPSRE